MLTSFTPDEVALICDLLDNINEDHDLSRLYSRIGHDNYSYWFECVYDKIESYTPITPISIAEIGLILDALQTLDNFEDSELAPNIRSALNSACRKAQTIQSVLLTGIK